MKTIPLSQGKVTLVDDEDFEELNRFKWCAHNNKNDNTFYSTRSSPDINGIWRNIRMHRIIMKCPDNMLVDHINGDGLDNRKENLRIVTGRENQQNQHKTKSSKYPGVCWHKRHGKWRVAIRYRGKDYNLGTYIDEEEAYKVYSTACKLIKKWETQ
jgi:hypothetical protein